MYLSSMKPIFFFLLVLAFSNVCKADAQSFSKTEKYICLDRVIIQFDEQVTEQQKESFFQKSQRLAPLSKSIRLDYPPVIIARLNAPVADYAELKQWMLQLQSEPEVLFVNPVLRNAEGDEVSVLQEVFVKVNDASQKLKLRELTESFSFEITGEYSYDENVLIITPKKNAALNSLELSCKLADLNFFEYVHPNFLFSPIVTTNDPFFNRQWNIVNTGSTQQFSGTAGADMSVDSAWTITQGDTSIKIAILDSGVDTLHPDLMPNLLSGYDATGAGSKGYPNKNFEKDAHGTACAGIAAAVSDNGAGLSGIAPNCRIVPIKVFYYVDTALGLNFSPPIPYTTSLWIADAINWAGSTGQADVMSNSWGVPDILFGLLQQPISLVEDAINHAHENGRNGKGTPQLFSTGNEDDDEPIWPSRLEQVIGVTATSMCDERKSPTSCDGENWWGGNYGSGTDVGAPGVKIPASDILGSKGFSAGSYTPDFNGTSAACPNAAGVMALILSVKPGLKAWDAGYLLASSADKVGGYDYDSMRYAGGWSQELGFGRVNAFNAVQLAMDYTGVKNNVKQKNPFSIYPNPLKTDVFTVKFEIDKNVEIKISLVDVSGKILAERVNEFQAGKHLVHIDAPLHPGIYFVEINTGREMQHLKLLFLGRQ